MTELEAIRARHSVRQYLNKPLKPDELATLRAEVDACNRESGLHLQLVTNEPKAFEGGMARYGKFNGVQNYFALVGKAGPDLQERVGYWGERLVLAAQAMGLNTCWVALTFTKVKSAYTLDEGEKLAAVISIMPQSVLGGAAVMMFSSIAVSGIKLLTKFGVTNRVVTIVSIAMGLGYGLGATAGALAGLIDQEELSADYIIPKAFDKRVGPAVAKAVADAARKSGVARL